MSVLHCVSSFNRKYPCEKLEDTATSIFISCCFISVFKAAIISYDFLKFHLTFIYKKNFITNFPLVMDLPKLPTPLTLNS